MKSIPPTARAAIAGAGGNRRRNLGSVSKLPALAQAVVGVSKTYCFWAWGAVRVGKLLGFFCFAVLPSPFPSSSFRFSYLFPGHAPAPSPAGVTPARAATCLSKSPAVFVGPGARRGVNCVFSTRCSAMWWACFSRNCLFQQCYATSRLQLAVHPNPLI